MEREGAIFTAVIVAYHNKLDCLPLQSLNSLIFAGKAEAYQNGVPNKIPLWALLKKIRLGWNWMEEANALAYYDTATITAVNFFIVQTPVL